MPFRPSQIPLSDPSARIHKKPEPQPELSPSLQLLLRRPASYISYNGPPRMQHQCGHPAVATLHPRDPPRADVRVARIPLRNSSIIVNVPQRDQPAVVERLQLRRRRELGSAFAVGDRDGQCEAAHAVEEDGGLGPLDPHHGIPRLELLARVRGKCGPVLRPGINSLRRVSIWQPLQMPTVNVSGRVKKDSKVFRAVSCRRIVCAQP